jgi:hypothetical protein
MGSALSERVQQSIHDAVYSTFAEAYQKARAYYDENKLDECIQACTEIINEGTSTKRGPVSDSGLDSHQEGEQYGL